MTEKTFYYCGNRSHFVTLNKVGSRVQVTATSSEYFPIGMANPTKMLRACGWRPARKVTQYDAWGRRI